MGMNNATISHTEFPPLFLNCGFDPCLMADVYGQKAHNDVTTETPFVYMKRLKADWKATRQIMEELKSDHVVQANKMRNPHKFCVGHSVIMDV